ncbi:Alpha/Beta hydrolase protein [Spinellus fusiger]|nr:Alpha/Beta hydrolase protein [Spinellus fusiger]
MSQQTLIVHGLFLTVYGLEEYHSLAEKGSVAVMFVLHGRLENMDRMKNICKNLCKLNENPSKERRHLIVVAFDQLNHGTRQINELSNYAWSEDGRTNINHAVDLWSMVYSCSRLISELIDVIEHYLFGPQPKSLVDVWGVLGISLGGHATVMAAAQDPRITVAIPIIGTADFLALIETRMKRLGLSKEVKLSKPFREMVQEKTKNLENRLKTTKLLMMNGGSDMIVPAAYNIPFCERLSKVHEGKRHKDWDFIIYPGIEHVCSQEMKTLSAQWCETWMVKIPSALPMHHL